MYDVAQCLYISSLAGEMQRERISVDRSMTLVEHECAIDNCESKKLTKDPAADRRGHA